MLASSHVFIVKHTFLKLSSTFQLKRWTMFGLGRTWHSHPLTGKQDAWKNFKGLGSTPFQVDVGIISINNHFFKFYEVEHSALLGHIISFCALGGNNLHIVNGKACSMMT
jgi:hypothetical protein